MSRHVFVLLGLPIALAAFWIARDLTRPPVAPMETPADTVILMVLDGVRPDELLSGADPQLQSGVPGGSSMPYMMQNMVPAGTFLGSDKGPAAFRLGNPMGISIPSYQSIFTGRVTACINNSCAPPWGSSLLTDIAQGFDDSKKAIGFFSSFGQICASLGVEPRVPGVICGPPDGPDLPDAEVFKVALDHLRNVRPRFLYIALGESDQVGHGGDYSRYRGILQAYDSYIQQLGATIADLAAAGHRVTLLVTTDHGRGEGAEWTEHRWNVKGTGRLWLMASGHAIAALGVVTDPKTASLYDIRPTVAHLLGLEPPKWLFQGQVITRILSPPTH